MRAPFAPGPDGSTRDVGPRPGPVGTRDAGSGGSDGGDAGVTTGDGGLVETCVAIDPGDPNTRLTVIDDGLSPPFELAAAYMGWDELSCATPTLFIGLTDGACVPGVGEQLLFAIDRDAIDATVTTGEYILEPDPAPLRLTFSRPIAAAPEMREVFGTCASGVLGRITFEALGSSVGSTWIANFNGVELPSCDPARVDSVIVEGSLEIELQEDLAEVCP